MAGENEPGPEEPQASDGPPAEEPAEDAADGTAPEGAEAPTAELPAAETEPTVSEATDEPTPAPAASTAGPPASGQPGATMGDRRVLVGVGAVTAAVLIGAAGFVLGDTSSSSSLDGSPVAYVRDLSRGGDASPRGFGDVMRDHGLRNGDCPDRE